MSAPSQFTPDLEAIARIDAVPLILEMVKQATGMRFAAVARVTDKNWVACAVDDSIDFGLKPGGELVLESTICHEIRQHREPVVFNHASQHPVYATHHTPTTYGLESYVSVPVITADNQFFGTLCAIDTVPADFDCQAVVNTLTLYAQLIAMNLNAQADLQRVQIAMAKETESGRLREQFIAVLGHDLRTPLSAVRMSAELLAGKIADARSSRLVDTIRQSSLRMGALIEDVLDFARGKLGGGITIKPTLVDDLTQRLHQLIDEARASHPQAQIDAVLDIPAGLYCDPARIEQLLSNLLNNAITHGASDLPVNVQVHAHNDELILRVINQGTPIAAPLLPLLFQPFSRSEAGQRGEGLGLGLYICDQICKSHNGTLAVSSTAQTGTCFVATVPAQLKWL